MIHNSSVVIMLHHHTIHLSNSNHLGNELEPNRGAVEQERTQKGRDHIKVRCCLSKTL